MNWNLYGYCVFGIAVSVLLPVLWSKVRQYFPESAGFSDGSAVSWLEVVKPYAWLCAASLVTGAMIMFLLGETIASPEAAVLAGYAWDSTLQKFKK